MDVKIIRNRDGDWEGLYIDDKLILEGHELFEGESGTAYMVAEKYQVDRLSIYEAELSQVDNDICNKYGGLPANINYLRGKYKRPKEIVNEV